MLTAIPSGFRGSRPPVPPLPLVAGSAQGTTESGCDQPARGFDTFLEAESTSEPTPAPSSRRSTSIWSAKVSSPHQEKEEESPTWQAVTVSTEVILTESKQEGMAGADTQPTTIRREGPQSDAVLLIGVSEGREVAPEAPEQVSADNPIPAITPTEQVFPPQSTSLQVIPAPGADPQANAVTANDRMQPPAVSSRRTAGSAALEVTGGNTTSQLSHSGPLAIQGTIAAENLNEDVQPVPSDLLSPLSDAQDEPERRAPGTMSARVSAEAMESEQALVDRPRSTAPVQNAAQAFASQAATADGALTQPKAAQPSAATHTSGGVESTARIDSIEHRASPVSPIANSISIPISQNARQLGVVHLSQQGTHMKVNVLTPDSSLARALQSQLPQLVENLARAGFESDFSTGSSTPSGFTSQIPRTTSMELGHQGLLQPGAESKAEPDLRDGRQRKQASREWQEWAQPEQDNSKERT